MIKYLLLLFSAAAGIFSLSAQENADTVVRLTHATDVLVIERGDTTEVTSVIRPEGEEPYVYRYIMSVNASDSGEREWNFRLPFVGDDAVPSESPWKPRREVVAMKRFYWGWNFNYASKQGSKNGFEVGIAEVLGVSWKPWRKGPSFDVGLGFGVRRILAADGHRYYSADGNLQLLPAPEGVEMEHSRLDVWTFHVPLMLTQDFGHGLGFSAGALVNFNTYATAQTRWRDGDTRLTGNFKGLHQQLLTVDIEAAFRFIDYIGIYCRWSPMRLFKAPYGPSFRTITLGAIVSF